MAGKKLVRVDREEKLVDAKQQPLWLQGFEGTSNNESLGSLIVNLPDGRNEPLTVGYHKVSVEIRDQIARTTIEESFVNHTDEPAGRRVPFPAAARCVDQRLRHVDRQRTGRGRRRREAAGPRNLRNDPPRAARSRPAGMDQRQSVQGPRVSRSRPHSEKRIKIVYTQVLPLRGEPLSLHLRPAERTAAHQAAARAVADRDGELGAAAQERHLPDAHGADAADRRTPAQVEFAAQEYTPTRDFEVVCEIDGRQSDVVVDSASPRRRRLFPGATHAARRRRATWQREVLPDGKPLEAGAAVRHVGLDGFREARSSRRSSWPRCWLRSATNDRFNLAAADVGTGLGVRGTGRRRPPRTSPRRWRFSTSGSRSAGPISTRRSPTSLKKSPADAQVIYIGDGIVTAGDTDPASVREAAAAG